MDQDALVSEQIEAGAAFLKQFSERFFVNIAFWLKPEGAFDWRLHIISEDINAENVTDGHREVTRLMSQRSDSGLAPFGVRLLTSNDRIAKAGIEREHLTRGLPSRHLLIHALAGFPLDDAYVYPMPSPEPVGQA
jgi:hypothetical protein